MDGVEIAHRAQRLLGAPFRLRGRDGMHGVDCVGLVAHAADMGLIASDYHMRGNHEERLSASLTAVGFIEIAGRRLLDGDIMLFRCAPRQVHLAVAVGGGAVHAHAGLRRVVWTPLPLPWPLIGLWRISGD